MKIREKIKALLKGLGGLLLLALLILMLVAPSPATRSALFPPAVLATLAAWEDAVAYSNYVAQVLLILFFGGYVFVQRFNQRVEAALGYIADQNVEAFNRAIAMARGRAEELNAYLRKFISQRRLSLDEWRQLLKVMYELQWRTQNPLHLFRGTIWVLAQIPGRLYGALAILLILVKLLSEMVLILIAH